ncbi:MAG: hypothetical protein H6573_00035, partial [Lewinellaceae bacterium]|nr:hypothetical protein [Lewinellaceae bacterium]
MDNNEDGVYNAGDMPLANVTVQLYTAGADYGVDPPLATDITDPSGYYYFDNLEAGTYVVYIPSSNFASGQALENKESYPGADAGNTDDNDNGQDTPVNGGIASLPVALTPGGSPVNEGGAGGEASATPQYPGILPDANVNETVDFTFRLSADVMHDKLGPVVSTLNADGSYDVTYTIIVRNNGGATIDYDLYDTPTFDDDIAINAASYTRDVPALPATPLSTVNGAANTLASDVSIAPGAVQIYTLTYNVTLDLSAGSGGDNIYTACGESTPGNPAPGEGLYNMSSLDLDDDNTPEETDEVCGDLPYITHRKDVVTVSPVPNPDGTYTVTYTVVVENLGGASGTYDLIDTPTFDNDITIQSASYSTMNVVPSVGGAALSAINGQPNTLANDISIAAGATQTYILTYYVRLDLSAGSTDGGDNVYTACGNTNETAGPVSPDGSQPGQGLYNATALDLNNDGTPEERDEICEDLPYITHEKNGPTISALQPDGSYNVTYTVTVRNLGGATGDYDLTDTPTFDDDIAINTASYTSDVAGLVPTVLSTTNGVINTLGSDVSIDPNETHTYTLSYNVTLDLSTGSGGDNIYTACEDGAPGDPIPGEGLYNATALDLNDDGTPEETDEVCGDLPYITHEKEGPVIGAQKPDGSYDVRYTITVTNTGGANGVYTLIDTPNFDDDITINSANYEWVIQPAGGAFGSSLAGAGPWDLATNQIIGAGGVHTYTLVVNVTLDLSDGGADGGDETYTACEDGTPGDPTPGEGLYNMTTLDTNNDGDPEEEDEVCGDLPYITHRKDMVMVSPQPNADGTYTVMYTVEVLNLGGAAGTYDLVDTPNFDDDIAIEAASYTTTNVVPSVAGGALSTINSDPNTLADDINIPAGETQTYKLTYRVRLDLSAGSTDGGDNIYTSCGTTTATPGPTTADASVPGQGLYNSTMLDTNNDGNPEEEDEICADLPYITHEKNGPTISALQPDGSYNVTYTVTV